MLEMDAYGTKKGNGRRLIFLSEKHHPKVNGCSYIDSVSKNYLKSA
jgi:hypothetical protein